MLLLRRLGRRVGVGKGRRMIDGVGRSYEWVGRGLVLDVGEVEGT